PTGYCTIPDRLNIPSEDVYRFLVNQPLSVSDDRTVPAALANFLHLQESLYGRGKVWVFRPGAVFPFRAGNRHGIAIGLAFLSAGLLWIGIGIAKPAFAGWFAVGMVFAIVGFLLALLLWLGPVRNPRIKNWRQSCLVLSPGGIGLMQGHLRGELKWQE